MSTAGTRPRAPRPLVEDDEYLRLPGLFRRWELEQVIEVGKDFHIEDAGKAGDGTPLVAVYWRHHEALEEAGR